MANAVAGKTSLTQQYVAPPTYTASYFPTIEATSHKIVTWEGQDYDCEIIDSAGQVSSLQSLSSAADPWLGRVHPVPAEVRRRGPWLPLGLLDRLAPVFRHDLHRAREDPRLRRAGEGALRDRRAEVRSGGGTVRRVFCLLVLLS